MNAGKEWNAGNLDWKRLALSLGISVLAMLTLTAAGAWLMDREAVDRSWMNYLAAAVLVASAFLGAMTAKDQEDRWKGPAIVGAGLWLVLLTINALCYDGDLSGAGAAALAILGGCGAAVLLGGGGKRRDRSRRKRRHR